MRRAQVCILLHMHQPAYVDPSTGRAELPWVRLHATRSYLDVARLLEEYPAVRMTVNFVPSLVAQLDAVADGVPDAWLEVAVKPARALTPTDREFLVARMFSLNWGRAVETRPRYRELLEKRGRDLRAEELPARAARFTDGELRDLTVLFQLGWMGFAVREGDAELAALESRGRDFSDEDLRLVVEKQRLACARVLPLWRKLADRGQVELSASPYYHPILPLVIDTETSRRSRPDLPLPELFAWSEDARAQIARGRDAHERTFGAPPLGMWPPEGSVSPEAVAAYGEAGIRWLATDEGNLWRTLQGLHRPHARGDLYRAYQHRGVDLVFRDREISDRIGFAYAHGDSQAGAHDLCERARACAALSTAPPDEPALVPIFLDGENPWESYPGSGEPFLRALFSELSQKGPLEPATIGEHLRQSGPRTELPSLHSGSWIDSDFHIWIGDPVKNRAWQLLGQVRRRFERARGSSLSPEKLEAAYEHILAAEGSDWFWWFGEPFHSAEDAIFDRLYRAHLAGALTQLGEAIPDELRQPVTPPPSRPGAAAAGASGSGGARAPYALIRPRIGEAGRVQPFYEWHGAGRWDVPRGAAMADSPLVERIHYGFDRENLYLRIDPTPGHLRELASAQLDVELAVLGNNGSTGRRLRVHLDLAAPTGWTLDESDGNGAFGAAASGGPAAFGRDIELGVPFARLRLPPGTRVGLSIRLSAGAVALARYPADGALAFTVPGDAFEAENWSA